MPHTPRPCTLPCPRGTPRFPPVLERSPDNADTGPHTKPYHRSHKGDTLTYCPAGLDLTLGEEVKAEEAKERLAKKSPLNLVSPPPASSCSDELRPHGEEATEEEGVEREGERGREEEKEEGVDEEERKRRKRG